MALSEVLEAEAGPHRHGLTQIAPEIVRWHLVHQLSDRVSDALASFLVVAEASTDRCRKRYRRGRVRLRTHRDSMEMIGLIAIGATGRGALTRGGGGWIFEIELQAQSTLLLG